jgi:hypothetical protein
VSVEENMHAKEKGICLKKLQKKLWFLQEAQGPVMVEDILKTDS